MSRGLMLTFVLGVLIALVGAGLLLAGRDAPEVTVYSSLPLRGPGWRQAQDMENGIRLAWEEADRTAGELTVRYVSLDDSIADAQGWAPIKVVGNALKAAEDSRAAVYIGEYDSGASALSIPILSRANVPQISPSNTAVGLTTTGRGASPGEPGKYYVDGRTRNYVRLVPRDTVQGSALTRAMEEDRCTHAAIVYDNTLYGNDLAAIIRKSMDDRDIARDLDEPYDARLGRYERPLADRIARLGADCVVFSGTTNAAVDLFTQLARKLPAAKLYGSSGLANRAIARALPRKVKLTFPSLGTHGVGKAGRRFFDRFRDTYSPHRYPDPYAIYGYEAMRLALDAIRRAGSARREDILTALRETPTRESGIGTYSIDGNGDTTQTDYGLFTIGDGGSLRFERTISTDG